MSRDRYTFNPNQGARANPEVAAFIRNAFIERVPAKVLAERLSLNHNTIKRQYGLLRAEGVERKEKP